MVAVPAKDVIAMARKGKSYRYCPDDIAANVSSTRLMAKDFPGWRTAADRGDGRLPKLRRYYYEPRLHGRAAGRSREHAREKAGLVHGGAAGGAGAAERGLTGGGGRQEERHGRRILIGGAGRPANSFVGLPSQVKDADSGPRHERLS